MSDLEKMAGDLAAAFPKDSDPAATLAAELEAESWPIVHAGFTERARVQSGVSNEANVPASSQVTPDIE